MGLEKLCESRARVLQIEIILGVRLSRKNYVGLSDLTFLVVQSFWAVKSEKIDYED